MTLTGGLVDRFVRQLEVIMGKWADLADSLKRRDQEQIDCINGMFGGGPTLENRLALADARALDALVALNQILRHLDEQDKGPNEPAKGPG